MWTRSIQSLLDSGCLYVFLEKLYDIFYQSRKLIQYKNSKCFRSKRVMNENYA